MNALGFSVSGARRWCLTGSAPARFTGKNRAAGDAYVAAVPSGTVSGHFAGGPRCPCSTPATRSHG
jgi:hypothetical protein